MADLLKGVRVLDMSRVLAGPLCGMTLGDLGADVIKVERPGRGDETREWGPPFDDRGQSAYFLCANRNKLGIALDLNAKPDQLVLERLIADTDVVIENFPPRAGRDRLLDPDVFLERHPRLVWLTLSGFGASSSRLGYDLVVQAECGWMSITGHPDGEPLKIGVALADVIAGKDAALAITAALWARDASAEPLGVNARHLQVSLAHSAVAALVNVAQNVMVSGQDAKRYGTAHPNLVPYQAFKASDRHIVIAVGNDTQWMRCCEALGLFALGSDPQLASNSGRLAQRDRVVAEVARRVAQGQGDEWIDRLTKMGVPCGSVRSVGEALCDVEHSPLTGIAPSVPGSVRFPPPRLNEHGEAIRQLGWRAFQR
jgi:crotonobetainyl-CoA:carnitine CoA-transferase CaiB-like acyl-CoA transferase